MASSAKNSNGFFGRHHWLDFLRRTYAEPGWVAIFAPGSEVELDQRSRVVRRRTFAELGWGGAQDFWRGFLNAWLTGTVLIWPAPLIDS